MSPLYSLHYTLCIVYCTMYTVRCTLYTLHYTLYIVHCTLNTVHCTLYTVQGIRFRVQGTGSWVRYSTCTSEGTWPLDWRGTLGCSHNHHTGGPSLEENSDYLSIYNMSGYHGVPITTPYQYVRWPNFYNTRGGHSFTMCKVATLLLFVWWIHN